MGFENTLVPQSGKRNFLKNAKLDTNIISFSLMAEIEIFKLMHANVVGFVNLIQL